VMGGSHLGGTSERRISSSFQELGVRYAGPCHWSDDTAPRLSAEIWDSHCAETGLRKVPMLATPE